MGKLQSGYSAALQSLGAWFERQKRVLPWRDEPTLYRVWVSEIMLQQTQVSTVVPYFERFMARFPTVESLARALESEVLFQWAGLGYYSRARNLHRAAQGIAQKGFPRDREGWLELPGVGQYTAGAILSIALNQPEAILDGNVERVVSRLRRVGRQNGDAAFKSRLWRLSRILVRDAARLGQPPSRINQALMELGATLCAPKRPRCEACPLSGICRAREHGVVEDYPPRRASKSWVSVSERTHLILDHQGSRFLVTRRAQGEWRAGLWDLPLTAWSGLERIGEVETRHVVTRHKITRKTEIWRAAGALGAAEPECFQGESAWIPFSDPDRAGLALGSALKRTLRAACERFPEALRAD